MLAYFGLTLFVSATLLFLVQPMIGKMILPQLGGTPAVWNTCMVFFQGVLLFGYGYTHLLTTTQPTRRQVIIHGILLFLPFIVLPFSLGNWVPPTDSNPIFELTWKLTLMVGLPFLAVSTTAPLMQKWFFHTGHEAAKDPYFLYGASNFGSMLGLALYPTVVEPWLPVSPTGTEGAFFSQVHLWTAGYAVFVALVVGSAIIVWQALANKSAMPVAAIEPAAPLEPATVAAQAAAITSAPRRRTVRIETAVSASASPSIVLAADKDDITLWRRLRWIGLAAAPSSLMLGVTTYMTTDIAAVAFFWIIPLAMYLLTFILVFARWPVVWTGPPHTVVLFLQPCLLLFLVLKMIAQLSPPTWIEFLLHLAAFFSTALMCHGELAKDRPSTKHLTEFYFWMSLGGVLGGLFNAFFAPIAFQHGVWEYPIAMAFACLLRSNLVDQPTPVIPWDSTAERSTVFGHLMDWIAPILIGFGAYAALLINDYPNRVYFDRYYLLGFVVLAALVAIFVYYSLYADRGKPFDGNVLKELLLKRSYPRFALFILALIGYAAFFIANPSFDMSHLLRRSYLLAILVVIALALSLRPVRFGLAVAALFLGAGVYDRVHDPLLYEGRGFFGLLRVRETPGEWYRMPQIQGEEERQKEWKSFRTLIHGGINHGRQIVAYKDGNERESPELTMIKRREPITYFHDRNGVAEIYHKLCWPKAHTPTARWPSSIVGQADARLPVAMVGLACGANAPWGMLANTQSEPPYAVVGLGTGLLACYAKPYQHVDFYEIDPLVKNLSIVPGYVPPWEAGRDKMPKLPDPTFYFVHDAQERWAKINVILGDGRLKIKEAPENYYHVISLDAFSSDAIPVHLLTAEAVELYMSKLAEGGVLIFNTTNRFVRIEGVLAAIAKEKGYDCLHCPDYTYDEDHPDRYSADWVVLQRRIDKDYKNGGLPIHDRLDQQRKRLWWDGRPVRKDGEDRFETRWQDVEPLPGPIWTDAHSNLLKIMRWR